MRRKKEEISFSQPKPAPFSDRLEVDTIIDKYRLREKSNYNHPSCVNERKRLIERYKGIKPMHKHQHSDIKSPPKPRTLLHIGDIRVVESQRVTSQTPLVTSESEYNP